MMKLCCPLALVLALTSLSAPAQESQVEAAKLKARIDKLEAENAAIRKEIADLKAAREGKGRPEVEKEKKTKLTELQKNLPKLIAKWFTENVAEGEIKTKVSVVRWLGPNEIKITCSCSFAVKDDLLVDGDFIATFFLSYYDGRWSTRDFRSNNPRIVGADLMLLVDDFLDSSKLR